MKTPDELDAFLASVMQTPEDAEFREQQFNLMLRGVRRRRLVVRWQRRTFACLAGLIVLTAAFWGGHALRSRSVRPATTAPVQLVLTARGEPPATVRSQRSSFSTVSSRKNSTPVVNTASFPPCFQVIGDDELVGQLAAYSGALFRRGPHEAEVVFVGAPQTGPN
jgi:hypothetical protein